MSLDNSTSLFVLLGLLAFLAGTSALPLTRENVTFTLGGLGDITGVVGRTMVKPTSAPYSNTSIYKFRNIPYAKPFLRFQQVEQWDANTPLSSAGPYDATRTGPLCYQGKMSEESINEFKAKPLVLVVYELDPEYGWILATAIEVVIDLLNLILELDPSVLGPVDGSKLMGDILVDLLDIDLAISEDCLHLAVTTPIQPDGSQVAPGSGLPVMFFIYGGAFYSGTQIMMGAERLAAWEQVVVVAINYRVGPLGFMCLDTDEAGGNMGLLDMVVALEWVGDYIQYFGGDPQRITIFGESAGSAAIGHLLLSEHTYSHFAQGIGQSGSALASWAFDRHPVHHAKNIAAKVGCSIEQGETHDDLVNCLRLIPASNISLAFTEYSKEDRANGGMGFGGSTPCTQTKGARQFYYGEQTPEYMLYSGQYERVPIMFGANSHEGSFVYATVYNDFFLPNNLHNDTDFLTHDLVHRLMQAVAIENSYPVEYLVDEAYIDKEDQGDLIAMTPTIVDMLGVFFLKASSYEFMAESSRQGSTAYWYSMEYASQNKSVFHTLFMGAAKKAGIVNPGACHGDELMYLFNVHLPLVLCDTSDLSLDLSACTEASDPPDMICSQQMCRDCVLGQFRDKWHNCITGELSEEELGVSALLASMWTSFAASGDPGQGAKPWSREQPWYSRITTTVDQRWDYRLTYHHARDEMGNSTTTESPSTTSSPEDCDQFKTDESCELDESNIIKERHNLLVGECQDICVGNSECNFFTWYPVPDQVEMGNDHGNCWLLRHCNSWEVCQACVSGPAGETDVDNCL